MPVFGEEQKGKGTPIMRELVGRVNDNTKRLRLLEERERMLTSRASSTEESVFMKFRELEDSIKETGAKVAGLEEKISTLQNTLKEVIQQIKFAATRSETKKLEEMIRIYDPLKSDFVTKSELKDAMDKQNQTFKQ